MKKTEIFDLSDQRNCLKIYKIFGYTYNIVSDTRILDKIYNTKNDLIIIINNTFNQNTYTILYDITIIDKETYSVNDGIVINCDIKGDVSIQNIRLIKLKNLLDE